MKCDQCGGLMILDMFYDEHGGRWHVKKCVLCGRYVNATLIHLKKVTALPQPEHLKGRVVGG